MSAAFVSSSRLQSAGAAGRSGKRSPRGPNGTKTVGVPNAAASCGTNPKPSAEVRYRTTAAWRKSQLRSSEDTSGTT